MGEDKCLSKRSLCFPGFVCKRVDSLVNGIKIKVHTIIAFVLVFQLVVNIAFVNICRIVKLYFTTRQKDGG